MNPPNSGIDALRIPMDLLFYRFLWYAFETGRLLRRYWKALFLITMLASPALMPVLDQARVLGTPALFGLSGEHSFGARLASLVLYEGAGVLWIMIQRNAVGGGIFADYLQSLPVSPAHSRRISLIILSIANTPLFLPVYAALFATASLSKPGLSMLYVLNLVLLTTSIQMAVLERALYRELPWIFLFTLAAVDAVHLSPPFGLLMQAGSAIAMLSALAEEPTLQEPRAGGQSLRDRLIGTKALCTQAQAQAQRHRMLSSALAPLYRLSARILLDRYRSATVSRGLVSLFATVGSIILMHIWGFDSRALPLALLTQALIAMITAGAYRDLRREHERATSYFAALPIPAPALARADTFVVVVSGLPFAAALAIAVALHRSASSVAGTGTCLASAALFVPLFAALRVPQVHLPRQSLVGAFLLTGAWTISVWLLLF